MSSSGDDREQTMHSGATERNGPSLGTDLGSEQGDRILTRNETVAPTEEGKEATTQGTTVVREGDQHLDPTLASLFTGMEQDEIIGFITSVMGPLSQQAAAANDRTARGVLFWHKEHHRSSATAALRPKRKPASARTLPEEKEGAQGSSDTSEGIDQGDLPEVCRSDEFLSADLPTAAQMLRADAQKFLNKHVELQRQQLQPALADLLTKASSMAFVNGQTSAQAGAEEELISMQDHISSVEAECDSLRSLSQENCIIQEKLSLLQQEKRGVEAGLEALQGVQDTTATELKEARQEIGDLKSKVRLTTAQLSDALLREDALKERYYASAKSESELRDTVARLRQANQDAESINTEATDQVTKYDARQKELVELVSMWSSVEKREGQIWKEVGIIRTQLAEGKNSKGELLGPDERKNLEDQYKAKTQWMLDDTKLLTERKKSFMRKVMGTILSEKTDSVNLNYKPPASQKPTREEVQNSIVRFVQNNPERYFALPHIIHRIMNDWDEENNQFWLIDFDHDVEESLLPVIEHQSKNLYEALKVGLDYGKHSNLWLKAVSNYSNGTKGESRKVKKECGIEITHALMSITSNDDIKNTLRINDRLSTAWRDFAMKYPLDVIQDQRRLLVRAERLKLVKMKVEDITKIIEVLRAREERLADLAQIYSEETGKLKDVAHEKALPFYGEFLCKVEKLIRRIEGSEEPAKITKKWKINSLKVTASGHFSKEDEVNDSSAPTPSVKSLKGRVKKSGTSSTKKNSVTGKSSDKLTCMATGCSQKSGLYRNRKDGTPWGNQENLIALCDSCKRDALKGNNPRLKNGKQFEKYETSRGYPAFRYCNRVSSQVRSAKPTRNDREDLKHLIREIVSEERNVSPGTRKRAQFSSMRLGDMSAGEIQEHLSNMTEAEFQDYWNNFQDN